MHRIPSVEASRLPSVSAFSRLASDDLALSVYQDQYDLRLPSAPGLGPNPQTAFSSRFQRFASVPAAATYGGPTSHYTRTGGISREPSLPPPPQPPPPFGYTGDDILGALGRAGRSGVVTGVMTDRHRMADPLTMLSAWPPGQSDLTNAAYPTDLYGSAPPVVYSDIGGNRGVSLHNHHPDDAAEGIHKQPKDESADRDQQKERSMLSQVEEDDDALTTASVAASGMSLADNGATTTAPTDPSAPVMSDTLSTQDMSQIRRKAVESMGISSLRVSERDSLIDTLHKRLTKSNQRLEKTREALRERDSEIIAMEERLSDLIKSKRNLSQEMTAQSNAREETLRLRQQLADSERAREETQQLRRQLADSEEERRLLQEDVAEHKQLLHDVMTEAEQLRADVQRLADSEQSARASLEVPVHSSVRSVRSVRSASSGAGARQQSEPTTRILPAEEFLDRLEEVTPSKHGLAPARPEGEETAGMDQHKGLVADMDMVLYRLEKDLGAMQQVVRAEMGERKLARGREQAVMGKLESLQMQMAEEERSTAAQVQALEQERERLRSENQELFNDNELLLKETESLVQQVQDLQSTLASNQDVLRERVAPVLDEISQQGGADSVTASARVSQRDLVPDSPGAGSSDQLSITVAVAVSEQEADTAAKDRRLRTQEKLLHETSRELELLREEHKDVLAQLRATEDDNAVLMRTGANDSAAARAEADAIKMTVATLEKELAEKDFDFRRLQTAESDKLRAAQEQLQVLEGKLAHSRNECQDRNRQLNAANSSLQTARDQLRHTEAEVRALRQHFSVQQHQSAQAIAREQALQQTTAQLTAKLSEVMAEKLQLQNQAYRLRGQLGSADSTPQSSPRPHDSAQRGQQEAALQQARESAARARQEMQSPTKLTAQVPPPAKASPPPAASPAPSQTSQILSQGSWVQGPAGSLTFVADDRAARAPLPAGQVAHQDSASPQLPKTSFSKREPVTQPTNISLVPTARMDLTTQASKPSELDDKQAHLIKRIEGRISAITSPKSKVNYNGDDYVPGFKGDEMTSAFKEAVSKSESKTQVEQAVEERRHFWMNQQSEATTLDQQTANKAVTAAQLEM